jgi:tetratricopeptide (TPR) repeat protein
LAFALSAPWLLSRAWGNAGQIALAQALVATPGEPVLPAAMEAEALLRQAVAYAPGNRSAWRGLGFALLAQGREQEALTAWKTAGEMAEELIQRGEMARRAKRYEEALVWYKRSVAFAPDSAVLWYYIGLMNEELENWDSALNAFQLAEKQSNNRAIAGSIYFHRGRIFQKHVESSDLLTALRLYEMAIDSDQFIQEWERIRVHFLRGEILRTQGRMQEAVQEFRWVVNAEPDHYWGHVQLGALIWLTDKDLNKAENFLKRAITLKPEEKWAYRWLGTIYQQAGNPVDAHDAYKRVLDIDPEDDAALQFFANQEDVN